MASTSATVEPPSLTSGTYSSLIPNPSYDVFMNYRGLDVKHTITSALYCIITGMLTTMFLDSEELKYGNFLPKGIEAAMSRTFLHITIFSMGYAESPSCLAEHSFMLETGATTIPIFYHVDPTDLRYVVQGKRVYDKAFKEHKMKDRYSLEQLDEWKMTLYRASFFTGQIIKSDEQVLHIQPL